MYDGREVANYLLDHAAEQGRSLTNLELQKLVFFCHAWTLVKFGRPLVRHQFEAWEYGPVLPYLYRDFRKGGDGPITTRATRIDIRDGSRVQARCEFPREISGLLESVTDFYAPLRPYQLVELSHQEGGPWDQVWRRGAVDPGMKISNESIEEFYSRAWGSSSHQ